MRFLVAIVLFTPYSIAEIPDLSRSVFKITLDDSRTQQKSSHGSGFSISINELVTNYHVVASKIFNPERYEIRVSNGTETFDAQVKKISALADLAILKIDSSDLMPVPLKLSQAKARSRTKAFAVGYPGNLEMTISEGYVNSLSLKNIYPRIQFTSALNPGMSGGPALNEEGEVIGVNFARAGDSIGLLIPSTTVTELMAHRLSENTLIESLVGELIKRNDVLIDQLSSDELIFSTLGSYELASLKNHRDRCDGRSAQNPSNEFSYSFVICELDEEITHYEESSLQSIGFYFYYLNAKELSPFQFNGLLLDEHRRLMNRDFGGTKNQFSDFKCERGNRLKKGKNYDTFLCARAHNKLIGLHDFFMSFVPVETKEDALMGYMYFEAGTFPQLQKLIPIFEGFYK